MLGVGERPGSGVRVSELLRRYYLAPRTALGQARGDRFRIYAGCIGGMVNGRAIANRGDLLMPMAGRVSSFARLWYANQYQQGSFPGVGHAGAVQALFAPGSDLMRQLLNKSVVMVGFFLDWLQGSL
jgi:hypothetical protein